MAGFEPSSRGCLIVIGWCACVLAYLGLLDSAVESGRATWRGSWVFLFIMVPTLLALLSKYGRAAPGARQAKGIYSASVVVGLVSGIAFAILIMALVLWMFGMD